MDKTSLGDRMKQQWVIDLNIPVFTQDRDYVNSLLTFDKEQKNDN